MKTIKLNILTITATACLSLLVACSPDDSQNTSSLADMNKALEVASTTMTSLDKSTAGSNSSVTKETVITDFTKKYAEELNKDPKLAHLKPIGVVAEADGSFSAYTDKNNNQIKDMDEKTLFKVEADAKNGRLLASNEAGVAEQPHSFMGGGFFMGMLLGNLLSRQRMTGANPSARRATPPPRKNSGFNRTTPPPRKSSSFNKRSPSVRSRAGSGSHASGK